MLSPAKLSANWNGRQQIKPSVVLFFILGMLFLKTEVYAQSVNFGGGLMGGLLSTPYQQNTQFNGTTIDTTYRPQPGGRFLVGVRFKVDYRFYRIANEQSLSVSVEPAFATSIFSFDDGGLNMQIDVPIFANYNFGLQSSPESVKNIGLLCGLGLVYHKVIPAGEEAEKGMLIHNARIQPMVKGGVRFFGKAGVVSEIDVRLTLFNQKTTSNGIDFQRGFWMVCHTTYF